MTLKLVVRCRHSHETTTFTEEWDGVCDLHFPPCKTCFSSLGMLTEAAFLTLQKTRKELTNDTEEHTT